jgi:hypothetical protein
MKKVIKMLLPCTIVALAALAMTGGLLLVYDRL